MPSGSRLPPIPPGAFNAETLNDRLRRVETLLSAPAPAEAPAPAASGGLAASLYKTGLTATLAATALPVGGAVLAPGLYRCSVYCTASPTGAASLLATFSGVDERGTAFSVGGSFSGSSPGVLIFNGPVRTNGTDPLKLTVTQTGTVTWDVAAAVERLL